MRWSKPKTVNKAQTDIFSTKVPTETKSAEPLTINDMFGLTKQGYLAEARKTAKLLLRTMDTITIEDVSKIVPLPEYLHRNTIGSVFNNDFVPVAFVKAKHKEAKGRWIREWRLK